MNLIDFEKAWLNDTSLTRVDVPGLYKSIFAEGGNLTCGPVVNAFGGCTIGGSSAINAGLYFQPPASDFDLYFPDGWKSEDMKPAFARLNAKQQATNITSQDGVRYLQSGYEAAKRWIKDGLQFAETDFIERPDNKTGVFGHPVYDSTNGQRGGPVVTYLQSAMKRENFHLQTNTLVLRVERTRSIATGVAVLVNGNETVVNVSPTGRVILSGGALMSPGLLMHSGIGGSDILADLQSAGKLSPSMLSSEWINSSAVGADLFDNPNTYIELEGETIESYSYVYDNPPKDDKQLSTLR